MGFHAKYPRREIFFVTALLCGYGFKHDSLDKAPLNEEALRRQQKLYDGSRFTLYKVHLLSCPSTQKLPGDIPWDAGLLCNKAAVDNCILYTSNCFHIEM